MISDFPPKRIGKTLPCLTLVVALTCLVLFPAVLPIGSRPREGDSLKTSSPVRGFDQTKPSPPGQTVIPATPTTVIPKVTSTPSPPVATAPNPPTPEWVGWVPPPPPPMKVDWAAIINATTDGGNIRSSSCSYKEVPVEGGPPSTFDKPNGWEFYTRHPSCTFSRQVTCTTTDGGAKAKNNARRKGKALVMMMLKAFDESEETTEWANIEYFLRMGYIPDGIQTELFEGVDFIFYRIRNDIKEVELCSKEGNVHFYFVPPGRCDLCAHARILGHIGYQPDGSATANFVLGEEGGFPYKQVIMLNSGVRGPIQHEDSGYWVDAASMAGEETRPQWLHEDLLQHWTTVAGTRVNMAIPWFGVDFPLHIQSYFLVVPISSLPLYYRLFLYGGCDGPAPHPTLRSPKFGCVVHAELRTIVDFVNPAANGLVRPPRVPSASNSQVVVDRPPHNYRVYLFYRRAMFGQKDNENSGTVHSWWHKHGFIDGRKGEGDNVDPCWSMFVKFGGEVYKNQGADFHKSVSYLSRNLKLSRPEKSSSRKGASGIGGVPAQVVKALLSGAYTTREGRPTCGLFSPNITGLN